LQLLLQDLCYAFRQLRKSPGFTIVAVLTLALGIGANTALYSVIHGALRLHYSNAERMVVVQDVYPQGPILGASWPDFLEWRSHSKGFTELVGLYTDRMTWRGIGEPEALNIGLVTEGYFHMYGMRPLLGRGFVPRDHEEGAASACVLGEGFWHEELKSDPSVIDKSLVLDGKVCTVIGVMPKVVPDSNHPAQVWLPMEPHPPYREHGTNFLFVTGELRPGIEQSQAVAELRSIQAQIDKQFPGNAHGVELQPLSQTFFGDLRSVLYLLLAAVGFILLIACVNLANMLLARASDREREFAVRRALGASAGRMMRQTLTESLFLSLSGAFIGLTVALTLTHIPIAPWPKGFTPPSQVRLDSMVLGFTMLLAVFTGILFGIIPAMRILLRDEKSALQRGRTITESREQARTRSLLVIAEIALSMLLITCSLNMAFNFIRLMNIDPGVNPKNVLSISVSLSPDRYPDSASRWRFYTALVDKLSVLPGVTHTHFHSDYSHPRFSGTSFGQHRSLWRDGLFRQPSREGVWHPNRPWLGSF
jgi:putative ABC transport system permease protein